MPIPRRKPKPATQAVAADCHVSIAAEIRRFMAGGTRQFLITSSGPGEGKSSVVSEVGRALARQAETRVVLVDTDQLRPSLPTLFETEAGHGLGELIQHAYGIDLTGKLPAEFGIGDWIELLQVQGRTGRLAIEEDGRTLVLTLIQGSIASITDRGASADRRLGQLLTEAGHLTPQLRDQALQLAAGSGEPLGEIALRLGYIQAAPLQAMLRAQFGERLQHMLAMRQPRCTFTPASERELGTSVQRDAAAAAGWTQQSGGMLMIRERLKKPFLSRQISAALQRTEVANLALLSCGRAPFNLLDGTGPAALRCILEHLASMFDVVLVDSPPVALGSPAEAISEMVGGTIMVVQADRFEVAVIKRAKDRLVKRGARLLGVILNQVDLQEPDQSFHYYYLYYPTDGSSNGRRKRRSRAVPAADDELPPMLRVRLEEREVLESIGVRPVRVARTLTLAMLLMVALGFLIARFVPWQHHAPLTVGPAAAAAAASTSTAIASAPHDSAAAPALAPVSPTAAASDSQRIAPVSAPAKPSAPQAGADAPAPPEPAAPPPARAAQPAPAKHYTISVGTFLEADRANAERRKIDSFSTLTASVEKVSNGGEESFRVVVGSFESHAAAVKAANGLIETGQVREALVLPAAGAAHN